MYIYIYIYIYICTHIHTHVYVFSTVQCNLAQVYMLECTIDHSSAGLALRLFVARVLRKHFLLARSTLPAEGLCSAELRNYKLDACENEEGE